MSFSTYEWIIGESNFLSIEETSVGPVHQLMKLPTMMTINVPKPVNQWYDNR